MTAKKHIAMHGIYLATFEHKDQFDITELTRIMTVLFAHETWSWRVIGITISALKQLKAQEFRYKSGSGITRAHQTPRLAMTRYVFERDTPLTVDELMDYWRNEDRTVICARGENVDPLPVEAIPIDNADGSLFTTQKVGFRLGKPERAFLENLAGESIRS